jgi:RNA recognition motif-containing protein
MQNKLFVGNLSWDVTDESLKDFFASAGEVTSARVITEKLTGRSRGFGFVEFSSDEEAQNAIDTLEGKDLDGREVRISIAEPRRDE